MLGISRQLSELPILHESTHSILYHSQANDYGTPVVVKVLQSSSPSPKLLAEINNEYALLESIEIEGVRRVYGRDKIGNRHTLILEYAEGESLRAACVNKRPEFNVLLNIAAAIARTLHRIHRRGIIHKHLTGDNILIDLSVPLEPRVTIIDFGIASRVNMRMSPRSSPEVLQGTLQYISPEQTGRMNRVVDYRTDLYSLGIVLYELFTGVVPFRSENDAMNLVHCHIAKRPAPVCDVDSDIPVTVSDIVSKLLSKNAEHRYQSAHGLAVDLERCLNLLREEKKISVFDLAGDDASGRLSIPERLYGRESQLDRLMAAFERVSNGAVELVLVTGSSGVGKSTLVSEIHKPITERNGYFISGKYEQYNRNVPYSALARAFDDFCSYVLTESDSRFEKTKTAILRAVGTNGRVLTDMFPRLELIIGEQPNVSEVGPQETQNRFNMVMQQFVRAVSKGDHPLVVFLDDLQWADMASLNLLNVILSDDQCGHLLILGAYRDNEVDGTHPLIMALEEIRRGETTISEIGVGDLSTYDVTQLVSEALLADPSESRDLAEVIVEHTGGNAFFTIASFKWLYEQDLLKFDYSKQAWLYDIRKIRDRQLTDDVVELMQSKIDELNPQAVETLTLAALIGHVFDLGILSAVCGKPLKETLSYLLEAVEEELVLPLDDCYLLVEDEPLEGYRDTDQSLAPGPQFRFAHDRILQAAHTHAANMDRDERTRVHLKVGRLLYERTGNEQLDEGIFGIVSHLSRGKQAMESESELLQLARLNVVAASKAKKANAYSTAIDHFQTAIDLFEAHGGEDVYEPAFTTRLELAETCYISGVNELAEEAYVELFSNARSEIDEVRIRTVQALHYHLEGQFAKALEVQRTALTQLGLEVPNVETDALQAREAEVEQVKNLLGDRKIASLIDEPELTREDVRAMLRILDGMLITAYCLSTRPELTLWVCAKMTSLSLEFGRSEFFSTASIYYGFMRCHAYQEFDEGFEFDQLAIALCEKYDNLALRCVVYEVFVTCCAHWKMPFTSILDPARRSCDYGLISGAFAAMSYSQMFISWYRVAAGHDMAEVHDEALKLQKIMARTAPFSLSWFTPCIQHIACLRGLTKNEVSLDNDDFNEAEHARQFADMDLVLSWTYSPKLQLYYLFEKYEEALSLVDQAEKMAAVRISQAVGPEIYFFASLTLAACSTGAAEEDRKQYLETIERYQARMKIWAASCEANYLHKYLLVEAERLRILDEDEKAIGFYHQGIESAKEYGFLNHEALGNELFAKFWFSRDELESAGKCMNKAIQLYQKWGAITKVIHLKERYSKLLRGTYGRKSS
ncbi:MAG: serine/threonine-protein kinase PknK [Proteobacteria bacterium]|nr:serine/threonine-protein kinase PknK [Pseudomonadota bacterium]